MLKRFDLFLGRHSLAFIGVTFLALVLIFKAN